MDGAIQGNAPYYNFVVDTQTDQSTASEYKCYDHNEILDP